MESKFKIQQKVKIRFTPDPEYVEYKNGKEGTPIEKGMLGVVNTILSNGDYHVEILDEKGEIFAYAPFDEEALEPAE